MRYLCWSYLWKGTSIPEGVKYPENACSALGWDCYNLSLGASGICLNQGFLNNGRDGKDLTETKTEKIIRYKNFVEKGLMTQEYYDRILSFGYEGRLIPFLDGTNAACDIIVIDHGFNDRNGTNVPGSMDVQQLYETFGEQDLSTDKTDDDFDRSNFIEAFCFLIKKIREVNPAALIVICSHLENTSGGSDFDDLVSYRGYYLCLLQQKIADHFGFPFLNICDYSGFTMDVVPNSSDYLDNLNATYGTSFERIVYNTAQKEKGDGLITYYQYYCPDGVHPHTDPTGQAERILTKNITMLLKERVVPKVLNIGKVKAEEYKAKQNIYDINGCYINPGLYGKQAYKGIYIKDGKKIATK